MEFTSTHKIKFQQQNFIPRVTYIFFNKQSKYRHVGSLGSERTILKENKTQIPIKNKCFLDHLPRYAPETYGEDDGLNICDFQVSIIIVQQLHLTSTSYIAIRVILPDLHSPSTGPPERKRPAGMVVWGQSWAEVAQALLGTLWDLPACRDYTFGFIFQATAARLTLSLEEKVSDCP